MYAGAQVRSSRLQSLLYLWSKLANLMSHYHKIYNCHKTMKLKLIFFKIAILTTLFLVESKSYEKKLFETWLSSTTAASTFIDHESFPTEARKIQLTSRPHKHRGISLKEIRLILRLEVELRRDHPTYAKLWGWEWSKIIWNSRTTLTMLWSWQSSSSDGRRHGHPRKNMG